MSVARERALTPVEGFVRIFSSVVVEMSVARERALTPQKVPKVVSNFR